MENKKNTFYKYIILVLIMMLATSVLSACSADDDESVVSRATTYEDLNLPNVTVGVLAGGVETQVVEEMLPNVKISAYNNVVDLMTAIESGKIEAIAQDNCTLIYHNRESGDTLRILDEYLKKFDFGFIFPKTEEGFELCQQMNAFLRKLSEDGTLDEIDKNWMSEEGECVMAVDYSLLPATNGVLRIATTATSPPFNYVENRTVIGYDLDIISRFCEEYGYGLEIYSMSFAGVIPAVNSGRCDIGASNISITDERRESVLFSRAYYSGGTGLAVLNPKLLRGGSTSQGIKESFQKTFIRQERYKLFLKGIWTMLLITVISAVLGTLLGFGVYMACRGGNRVVNAITSISTSIIQGPPLVVLLMIFYYIIFGRAHVTGTFVSVVVFTLTFGTSVYNMLCTGVKAVDIGQTEAAYSLGFSKLKTFFVVILPQAMTHILPIFRRDLSAHIKATAIVGYIAVQDLTRMGDIVRSRTYDAFFPLIAVAVIYFIYAKLMSIAVTKLEAKVNPKLRTKEDILKGVITHD